MNLRAAFASVLLHAFFLVLGVLALVTPDEAFTGALGVFGTAYIVIAATNARAILLNQLDRVRLRRG
jgi:threonine/homoserine/homoserine lactone efflux protein